MRITTAIVLGLLFFTVGYSMLVFNSDFGVPETSTYNYGYPCNLTFVQTDNLFGYQFKNCYVLKLNWWDKR